MRWNYIESALGRDEKKDKEYTYSEGKRKDEETKAREPSHIENADEANRYKQSPKVRVRKHGIRM
jgi:hypothetical protein